MPLDFIAGPEQQIYTRICKTVDDIDTGLSKVIARGGHIDAFQAVPDPHHEGGYILLVVYHDTQPGLVPA